MGRLSILVRKLAQFVKAEHGTVLADILRADVASSALADAALHSQLHCGVDLSLLEAELRESAESEFNHYRRSAHENSLFKCREPSSFT